MWVFLDLLGHMVQGPWDPCPWDPSSVHLDP